MFSNPFAARGIVAGLASLTLVGALAPASASASTSDTYVCTNGPQSSTAPSGAVSARVTLNGAAGKASASGASGGTGEGLAITMPVTPGQQFDVYVGCQNGYGGGGPGGPEFAYDGFQPVAGGSGGGASYLVPAGGASRRRTRSPRAAAVAVTPGSAATERPTAVGPAARSRRHP